MDDWFRISDHWNIETQFGYIGDFVYIKKNHYTIRTKGVVVLIKNKLTHPIYIM